MAMEKIVGTRAGDPRPTVSAEGRVCATVGCETVLSRYNPDKLCGPCERTSTVVRKRKSPTLRTESEDDALFG